MRSLVACLLLTLLFASGCNCGASGPPCGVPLDERVNATLYVTADDETAVYLNGVFIGAQGVPWDTNALERTILVNRNPTLPNVVAVLAWNRFKLGGLDRGMLVDFRLGDAGLSDAPRIFASGAGWKVRTGGDAGLPEYTDGGWTAPGFDDSAWGPSVVTVPYGSAPYGANFQRFGITSAGASWMWAYDPRLIPVADKLTDEALYFRHVFFFAADGGFSTDAGVCP